ncbi:MAG: ribulose-phosphate 3-epimerase [Verrucomicrobiota bacterium]|nr:MAG: ribulose-phosphate 3-epimerase [Verrucomicrobiota bacterium]
MVIVAPSIFAGDLSDLRFSFEVIHRSGASWVHIDVMDGHFVPNLALGPETVRRLLPYKKNLKFEVHLMLEHPQNFIESFAQVGADRISVHIEASDDPQKSLTKIRQFGLLAGLAVNPETPVETAILYYPDYYVVMGVHPGFAGQTFIPGVAEKIQKIHESDPTIPIEVDGGMDLRTAPMCIQQGASIIVAGSAFFHAPDPRAFVQQLEDE